MTPINTTVSIICSIIMGLLYPWLYMLVAFVLKRLLGG